MDINMHEVTQEPLNFKIETRSLKEKLAASPENHRDIILDFVVDLFLKIPDSYFLPIPEDSKVRFCIDIRPDVFGDIPLAVLIKFEPDCFVFNFDGYKLKQNLKLSRVEWHSSVDKKALLRSALYEIRCF